MKTTAYQLAQSFALGTACPVSVLDHLYQNLSNAPNAFITLTKERAYQEADAAKKRWQMGNPLSVFDGVPIAYKDLFDLANTITTAGAKVRQDAPTAQFDATTVADLRRMGLVAVGKTNLSEFAYSGLGLNPHFGTPPNVVNNQHIAGGSSSGSATVVGANLVPLAMGTDTAGSIRIPSSFNGLVGFRASCTRYDKTGVFPLATSLDTLGSISHSALDCWLVDRLLQNDTALAYLDSANYSPWINAQAMPTLVYDDAIVALADDTVAAAFWAWLESLTKAGFIVRKQSLMPLHQAVACIDTLWLGAAEAYALHESLLASTQAELLDRRVRHRLESAKDIKASEQIHLYQIRKQLQREMATQLGNQLLLLPTVAHTAPKLAPLEQDDDYFAKINKKTLKMTMIGSFLDMPSLNMPIANDPQGLPIGACVAGATGLDHQLLSAGCLIEFVLGR